MKVTAPALVRIRYFLSHDARFAQFLLTNKAGQNFSFTVPFGEIGVLIGSIQKAARAMAAHLHKKEERSRAAIASALSTAPAVTAVALGRDAETGDTLLWVETTEGGGAAYRLGDDSFKLLDNALAQHRSTSAREAGSDRDAAE